LVIAICLGLNIGPSNAQSKASFVTFASLSALVKNELDLDLVLPFISDSNSGPSQTVSVHPGAIFTGDVQKSSAYGKVQWNLEKAIYCPAGDDGRDDLQPGLEILDTANVSPSELLSVMSLPPNQLNNINNATVKIAAVSFRSIGSDAIASRSRSAFAACSSKSTSARPSYVVRRTASGKMVFKFALRSEENSTSIAQAILHALNLLGVEAEVQKTGQTLTFTPKKDALIGISLRQWP
jgi:hypothetical protein